jgi:hypothetical protein
VDGVVAGGVLAGIVSLRLMPDPVVVIGSAIAISIVTVALHPVYQYGRTVKR